MRCKIPESIRYAQVAMVVEELYKCYTEDYVCVTRKVYKRLRTPRFLWERRVCVNSGSQAVFFSTGNGLGIIYEARSAVWQSAEYHAGRSSFLQRGSALDEVMKDYLSSV